MEQTGNGRTVLSTDAMSKAKQSKCTDRHRDEQQRRGIEATGCDKARRRFATKRRRADSSCRGKEPNGQATEWPRLEQKRLATDKHKKPRPSR